MARLIDADALLELVQFTTPINNRTAEVIARCVDTTRGLIEAQPTIDAVEVVHGRWNKKFLYARNWDEYYEYRCPFCGIVEDKEHNYCPHCGANMMDGGEDE